MVDEPAAHIPRRVYDKLLEYGFYIGSLALIGLMEWYAHLTGAPRMPWAYFALIVIAIPYLVHRIRSFKARDEQPAAARQEDSARAVDSNEPGAVRIAGRAPGA